MEIIMRLCTEKDIDLLESLYDRSNDYLASTTNYPGWIKGVYPIRQNAINGINEESLFVATVNNEIVGSIILNHQADVAYSSVTWQKIIDNSDILVIHTFVVDPKYLKHGIGRTMLEFASKYATDAKMKALRLDVYEKNTPAISLYESCGYKYIDTVSLGLEKRGLNWFRLYEKLL